MFFEKYKAVIRTIVLSNLKQSRRKRKGYKGVRYNGLKKAIKIFKEQNKEIKC